jgi:hypothetical protein
MAMSTTIETMASEAAEVQAAERVTAGRGAVTGMPRALLRAEGAAAFVAGVALYLHIGGQLLWLIPLLLLVDVSMVGYVAGPRPGAVLYDVAHNWAVGLAVLAVAWWSAAPAVALAGAILVAHTGMDRSAGYGLKYPTAFADTHLGWLGRPVDARHGSPR